MNSDIVFSVFSKLLRCGQLAAALTAGYTCGHASLIVMGCAQTVPQCKFLLFYMLDIWSQVRKVTGESAFSPHLYPLHTWYYSNIKWVECIFVCIFSTQDFSQKAEKELYVFF